MDFSFLSPYPRPSREPAADDGAAPDRTIPVVRLLFWSCIWGFIALLLLGLAVILTAGQILMLFR
jgi:hypothetical protein